MSDITRKGWRCDCCNKEFYEGDCGYSVKYTVRIETNSAYGRTGVYDDVCNDCIDAILEILEPSDIN